jgi:Flp pilus assembly protein TadD
MIAVAASIRRWSRPAAGLFALLLLAGCISQSSTNPAPAPMPDLAQKGPSLIRLAETAQRTGDFQLAVNIYRKVLEQNSDDLVARLGLGASLLANGDPAAAAQEYQKAAALAPERPEPQMGLGRVYLARKDGTRAYAAAQEAMKRGAADPGAYDLQAMALDLQLRHRDAQAIYEEGIVKFPDDRALRNNYGFSLILSKNYADAVRILEPLAREPGATRRNRQNLALALGLEGRAAEANAVAGQDLDDKGVENNQRFYDFVRTGIASAGPTGK